MTDREPSEAPLPVDRLSYTEASRELDQIVEFFEGRDVDVDQLVARLERATAIVDELDRRIKRTKAQVEQLVPRLSAVTRRAGGGQGAEELSGADRGSHAEVQPAPGGVGERLPSERHEARDDDDEGDEDWETEAIEEQDVEEELDAWDEDDGDDVSEGDGSLF